jgi:hypothetical protein
MSQLETNSRVTLSHKDQKQRVKWLGFGRSRDEYGPQVAFVITTENGETQNLYLPTDVAHMVACGVLSEIRSSEEHYRANFGNWHDGSGFDPQGSGQVEPAYVQKKRKRKGISDEPALPSVTSRRVRRDKGKRRRPIGAGIQGGRS